MIPENTLTEEAKNGFDKIKEIEKAVHREKLVDRTNEYTYSFKNFRTISTIVGEIYNGKIILNEADEDQSNLLVEIMHFKKKTKPQNPEKKQEKKDILKNFYTLFEGRGRVLDAFESKMFPIKIEGAGFSENHSNLKTLTPKQVPQRLPMVLAQVKACNTSQNLLNEIRQIIYSLYRAKEITKKV